MRLLLLGPPGSGKGTQGQNLARVYNVPHIATGDMIREQIVLRTPFGCKVEETIAQGHFAPDEDMIRWIEERLAQPDARRGYVLDGFPRGLAQAQAFDDFGKSIRLDAVIELRMTDEALIERLRGRWICSECEQVYHEHLAPPDVHGYCDREGAALIRRTDDHPETVRERIRVYEDVTLPLRSYYGAQGFLVTIDAHQDADSVGEAIIGQLTGLASRVQKCVA